MAPPPPSRPDSALRAWAPIAVDDEDPSGWPAWTIGLSLAILLHLLLLLLKIDWSPSEPLPRPVELQQVDPRKLEAVRKQWRERDRALLLNKNQDLPKDVAPPKDARYESDRNIRVEREQRARQTNVIPKPSQPAVPAPAPQEKPRPERSAPRLGQLGLPLNLAQKPRPRNRPRPADAPRPEDPGGDQALRERNLVEGSENLLNAQESVYYSFYSRLYEAIGPIWQSNVRRVPFLRRVAPGEYTTTVDVVFDAAGNLLEVRQIESSGINEFDQAVPDSWKRIGTFPNPPTGLLNRYGEVHTGWTFTVNVGEGAGIQYLPPERVY